MTSGVRFSASSGNALSHRQKSRWPPFSCFPSRPRPPRRVSARARAHSSSFIAPLGFLRAGWPRLFAAAAAVARPSVRQLSRDRSLHARGRLVSHRRRRSFHAMDSARYGWVPLSGPVGEDVPGWMEAEATGGIPYAEISLSTLCWCTLYFSLQYFNAYKSSEWNCRMVTCIHALLITALSIYSAFILGPNPIDEPGRPNTDLELSTLSICLGYFIYDMVWCLYHQSEGVMIMVHHLASIVCLLLPLNLQVSGGEVVVSIAAMEITNPLLQMRWFLRESGYKDSPVTTAVDVLFIAMFFFMRMVYGTYLLFAVTLHPRPYVVIKLGGASFCIISYIFMYMIFRYAYRKYVLKSKRPEDGAGSQSSSKGFDASPVTGAEAVATAVRNGKSSALSMRSSVEIKDKST